ncbi:snake venom metalloproteinase lebetase-4-like [Amphiura filiformis]|uniref:snake venom metalloproteinase lebetase-4-like n=1 Tax=Amphiura filiformis TaxID=82378 RepID=UPI003B20F9C8
MSDIKTRSFVPDQKYLKLHIVADHQYWTTNGAESCKCITATFQALAHRMALLPSLNLLLSRITIIKTNTILNTISTKAGTNLELTREWTDNHPDKAQWDHVSLVVPMYMDVAGVAWVCSVCGYNKISVSYIGALYGVQVMAHEMGHNLCLSHTTGGFNCGRQGYVMGAAGWSDQEMGWAQCSLHKYLEKINSFSCLSDQ